MSVPLEAKEVRLLEMLLNSPLFRVVIDSSGQLKVVQAANQQRLGYVGTIEKLLAAPYADTAIPLGANAVYTGTTRDLQESSSVSAPYCYYGGIRALASADQSGILVIDESSDNTTWITSAATAAVAANTPTKLEWKAVQRYIRVRYVNGGSAQGSFKLWSRVVGANV